MLANKTLSAETAAFTTASFIAVACSVPCLGSGLATAKRDYTLEKITSIIVSGWMALPTRLSKFNLSPSRAQDDCGGMVGCVRFYCADVAVKSGLEFRVTPFEEKEEESMVFDEETGVTWWQAKTEISANGTKG